MTYFSTALLFAFTVLNNMYYALGFRLYGSKLNLFEKPPEWLPTAFAVVFVALAFFKLTKTGIAIVQALTPQVALAGLTLMFIAVTASAAM